MSTAFFVLRILEQMRVRLEREQQSHEVPAEVNYEHGALIPQSDNPYAKGSIPMTAYIMGSPFSSNRSFSLKSILPARHPVQDMDVLNVELSREHLTSILGKRRASRTNCQQLCSYYTRTRILR